MYKKPLFFFLITPLFLSAFLFKALPLAADTRCRTADKALKLAVEVRGLKAKKSVPCKVQNKEQVRKYLVDSIDKNIPADKLKGEELVYKHLGILELDFDYKSGVIELYTQNLGGYYEPVDEYYVMAGWMPDFVQLPIAVHEQVHALQDQHFKLDDLLNGESADSDALLARSALAEGDATCVMYDFANKQKGLPLLKDMPDVSSYILQSISSVAFSSMGSSKLEALKATLIFPYVSGLRFAHQLLRDGGYPRIDQAFKNLPSSTEEILHPEIYLKGVKSYIKLQALGAAEVEKALSSVFKKPGKLSSKTFYEDRYGEFFISTWLAKDLGPLKATKAAGGWGGDKVALYYFKEADPLKLAALKLSALKDKAAALKKPELGVLAWSTHWDTELDAKEFYDAVLEAYGKREGVKGAKAKSKNTFTSAQLKTLSFFDISVEGRYVKLISAF